MFGRVDGSMARAARSRRTGGRAVLARASSAGNPALPADEPKGTGGNTGNTGNPLPESGALDSSTLSGTWGASAGDRFAPDGLAEMGGNWRKLPEGTPALRIRGYDGAGWEKGSE
jgi:hypothetical protein